MGVIGPMPLLPLFLLFPLFSPGLPQIDDSDAGTAEADILVGIGPYRRDCIKILPYCGTQRTRTGAVQDAHASGAELHSVIYKVHHGL